MRRSLILTVAASVSMVLLAMLVPMAVLVRGYAQEDLLSRAALEVQGTETVVSGQDKGAVSVYVDRVNRDRDSRTTVLYPDGTAIGPDPEENARVVGSRNTGRARVDDIDGATEILVPVSRGGNSALPSQTPVIRVVVPEPGLISSVYRSWLVLAALGLVLLIGSLVLADRLGRWFVEPIRTLAAHTRGLGERRPGDPVGPVQVAGPAEVTDLAAAINRLVERVEVLLRRERESVSDLSHRLRTPITALRLGVEQVSDPGERARLTADLDALHQTVDQVVREARRSEREGVDPRTDGVAVLLDRVRWWEPLAEEQGRPFTVDAAEGSSLRLTTSAADLQAVVDVLLDNVFTHTPEGAAVRVTVAEAGDRVLLRVEDGGPGFPEGLDVAGRGTSGTSSTGLGLAIVARTSAPPGSDTNDAAEGLRLGRSPLGGASVEVLLG